MNINQLKASISSVSENSVSKNTLSRFAPLPSAGLKLLRSGVVGLIYLCSFCLSAVCFSAVCLYSEAIAVDPLTSSATSLVASVSQGISKSDLERDSNQENVQLNLQGWEYLRDKLIEQGIETKQVDAALSDKRMPARDALIFSLNPKEKRSLYRKHNTKAARTNAIKFYKNFIHHFKAAEAKYEVPAEVILAIIQVESNCGKNTGKSRVLPGLARLAAAHDPGNLQINYARHDNNNDGVDKRAKWLEDTFLPHVAATFHLAKSTKTHPLELRGSGAGAIGLPQFLPGHVYNYGIDGNGDHRVNLYEPADAIPSVGNFLKQHGWRGKTINNKTSRQTIYHYNRSTPYIDTVLAMANQLRKDLGRSTGPASTGVKSKIKKKTTRLQ